MYWRIAHIGTNGFAAYAEFRDRKDAEARFYWLRDNGYNLIVILFQVTRNTDGSPEVVEKVWRWEASQK